MIKPPRTYSDLLFSHTSGMFLVALMWAHFLRFELAPALWDGVQRTNDVSVLDKTISFGFPLAIAIAYAIASNVFRFHDKISDLFGIRIKFDSKAVLQPLAIGSGVANTKVTLETIKQSRASSPRLLMTRVFYRFLDDDKAEVDSHLIKMAYQAWLHYWLFLESFVLSLIMMIPLFIWGNNPRIYAALLSLLVLLGGIILWYLMKVNKGCARDEVEAILLDPSRKQTVIDEFNEIFS